MKIFIIILCFFFAACTTEKNVINDKPYPVNKDQIKTVEPDISLGWSDEDTYTVRVVSNDLDSAIDAARHKILHDIVKVRMINESRFTDISKISEEFEKPLKGGLILNQRPVTGGVEIYYQITDTGLKKKFQRK